MEEVWGFLKELKRELPYDLAILHLDIYARGKKSLKKIFYPMFNAVLSTITKYGYNLSVHQDSWENKMWCAYAMEYS